MLTRIKTPSSQSLADVVGVEDVTCSYGDHVAVNGVTISVPPGRIHALLGTNGAGKTTLLETVQGLRRASSGSVRVLGWDPWRHRSQVAGRTGTMLQESGLVDEMTVLDQLTAWKGLNLREDSVDHVLSLVGLEHRQKVPVGVLSGGERRRLDFAMALWGNPELIVLDEPTTGLDPQSRRSMWSIIRELNAQGSTVLLTTHYLDEAQSLAHSVTILDRGRVAATGSMSEVLAAIPARITFDVTASDPNLAELITRVSGEVTTSAGRDRRVILNTPQLQEDVGVVIDWARAHSLALRKLHCAPASLEEAFFRMPSIATREAEAES